MQLPQRARRERVAERLGVKPRMFTRDAIVRAVEEAERRLASQDAGGSG